jgi:cell division protein FtsN
MKDSTKILEEKGSLFVFDRTEVVLILVFVLIIAATSFTLGIRVGKKLLLESRGFTQQDVRTIELKSTKEEYVDQLGKKDEVITDEKLQDEQFKRIKEEFEKLENSPVVKEEANSEESDQTEVTNTEAVEAPAEQPAAEEENPYLGKYTIQLGSYQSLEDAKNFAEGFVLKGYDPIINRVEIEGKGFWYRVSIGAFENRNEATEYIQKEQSLFLGKEYRIYQVK